MRSLLIILYFGLLFNLALAVGLPLAKEDGSVTEQQTAQVNLDDPFSKDFEFPELSEVSSPVTGEKEDAKKSAEAAPVAPEKTAEAPAAPSSAPQISEPSLDATPEIASPEVTVPAPTEVAIPEVPNFSDQDADAVPVTVAASASEEVSALKEEPAKLSAEKKSEQNEKIDTASPLPAIEQFPSTPSLGGEEKEVTEEMDTKILSDEEREKKISELLNEALPEEATEEEATAKAVDEIKVDNNDNSETPQQAINKMEKEAGDISPDVENALTEDLISPIDDTQIVDEVNVMKPEEQDVSELSGPSSLGRGYDSRFEDKLEANSSYSSAPYSQASYTTRQVHKPLSYSEQQLVEQMVSAAMSGNRQALLGLLNSGRDVNSPNRAGVTSLMAAIYSGTNNIVELLISEGADVNSRDINGNYPIHIAVTKNNVNAIQQLIRAGAKVDVKNKSGDTPLLIATLGNSLPVVDALIREGADSNLSNKDGLSPLHIAASNGNVEITKYLLMVGANKQARMLDGRTPYDLALSKSPQVAGMLAPVAQITTRKIASLPKMIQDRSSDLSIKGDNNLDQYSLIPSAYKEDEIPVAPPSPKSAWWAADNAATDNLVYGETVTRTEIVDTNEEAELPASLQFKSAKPNRSYAQSLPVEKSEIKTVVSTPVVRSTPIARINANTSDDKYVGKDNQLVTTPTKSIQVQRKAIPVETVYASSNPIAKEVAFVKPVSQPIPQASKVQASKPIVTAKAITPSYAEKNSYVASKQVANAPIYKQAPQPQYSAIRQPIQTSNYAVANNNFSNGNTYNSFSLTEKAKWDSRLENWVKNGLNARSLSAVQLQKWKEQKSVLESIYGANFKNAVQSSKSRLVARGIYPSAKYNSYSPKVSQNQPAIKPALVPIPQPSGQKYSSVNTVQKTIVVEKAAVQTSVERPQYTAQSKVIDLSKGTQYSYNNYTGSF